MKTYTLKDVEFDESSLDIKELEELARFCNIRYTKFIDVKSLIKKIRFKENEKKLWLSSQGVRSISEIYELVKKIDSNIENRKILFRGEKEHYENYCMPNLYRNLERDPDMESIIHNKLKSDVHIDYTSPDLHAAIIAQHGGLNSRLLDLTSSLLVAIYFATEPNDCLSSEFYTDSYIYVFETTSILDPNDLEVIKAYQEMISINSTSKKEKNDYEDFYFIGSSRFNERLINQQGHFCLINDCSKDVYTKLNLSRIKINGNYKKSIQKELIKFYGIDKYYIYPEIFSLNEHIKNNMTIYTTFRKRGQK